MRRSAVAIISIIGLLICLFVYAIFERTIGRTTVESLLGAFFGTAAGATVIYSMQLRMEQTRFFQLLISEIKAIYSSTFAWHRVKDYWIPCEFRMAVGLAKWTNDPDGIDGQAHLNLHVDSTDPKYRGIDWNGVVYKIDEDYCVASKALHDYANWYNLLLNGLENELLSRKHVLMLWRSIVDAFYWDEKNSIGMKRWTEFFVFGGHPKKHSTHEMVLALIHTHSPARRHKQGREQFAKQGIVNIGE